MHAWGRALGDAHDVGEGVNEDHKKAIDGGMFFHRPDDFDEIIARLAEAQNRINCTPIDPGVHGG